MNEFVIRALIVLAMAIAEIHFRSALSVSTSIVTRYTNSKKVNIVATSNVLLKVFFFNRGEEGNINIKVSDKGNVSLCFLLSIFYVYLPII